MTARDTAGSAPEAQVHSAGDRLLWYRSTRKAEQDQRRVLVTLAEKGKAMFESMSQCMEGNYQRLQDQLGEEKLQTLLGLLDELKNIKRV